MDKAAVEKSLKEFLYEEHLAEEFSNLSNEESLLKLGIIDSVKMLDLIMFIEQNYNIKVDEDDMTPDNFDTIDAIVDYIGMHGASE